MAENIFELKNASYSYNGINALAGINFTAARGEKVILMGANGSGKSTLLAMLDGLIFPDKGGFFAFGAEINEKYFLNEEYSRSFRSKVGFVFQNPEVQLFCPTIEEDLVFGPLQLGHSRAETEERLEVISAELGIKGLLKRQPHMLSIGEKKKAAIASTLMSDPEALLLDEPTAGLDPTTSMHIMDMLLKAAGRGKTIITATHDFHIVEEIADRVIILSKNGTIAASGTPADILNNTKLLEENNLLHAHGHRHTDGSITHSHPHLHSHIPHTHNE